MCIHQFGGILWGTQAASNEVPLKICLMDNRGVGRSSSPRARTAYSTTIMAADCIALMVHQLHILLWSLPCTDVAKHVTSAQCSASNSVPPAWTKSGCLYVKDR